MLISIGLYVLMLCAPKSLCNRKIMLSRCLIVQQYHEEQSPFIPTKKFDCDIKI